MKNLKHYQQKKKKKKIVAKGELKAEQDKIAKLDPSLFIGQIYFNNDETKFYLTFQSIYKLLQNFLGIYLNLSMSIDEIVKWKIYMCLCSKSKYLFKTDMGE